MFQPGPVVILGDQALAGGERLRVVHVVGDLLGGHRHMAGAGVKGDKAEAQILQLFQHFAGAGVGHLELIALELGELAAQLADHLVAVEHVHFPGVDLVGQAGAFFFQALLQGELVLLGEALHLAALLRVAAGALLQAAVEGLHLGLEGAVLLAQGGVLRLEGLELHQHLFQLGAEDLFLLLLGVAQLRQLLLLAAFQGVDAQPQFLDGARQAHPLGVLALIGAGRLDGGHRLVGEGRHGARRRQVVVHFQAHLGAALAHQITGRHEVVGARLHGRVPELILVPGHRALAAAGQADRPGAHVRAGAAVLGQVAQGHVPGVVGHAVLVEADQEQHQRLDLELAVDHAVGAAHFPARVLGHPDHAVQNRLEIGVQHALGDALAVVEQNRFGGYGRTRHDALPIVVIGFGQ